MDVIAGITTASAAAAQFGFSLTERATARQVLLATGRTLEGVAGGWETAANTETTLCLYMGCGDIAALAHDLIAAGRAPSTPALAGVNVERPGAQLIKSTLSRLAQDVEGLDTGAPVFITIGQVCVAARATSLEAEASGQLQRDRRKAAAPGL